MRPERSREGGDERAELVTLDDLFEARQLLRDADVLRPTPPDRSDNFSRLTGRTVWLKPEHLQRTGSFKIRGAYNHISRLPPGQDVVAASAGNHAQGVALAAALTERKATIFMPAQAPVPKVEATRGYGASVQFLGDSVDDCLRAAREDADERGAAFVPPFDDLDVIAGQGTAGLELVDEVPDAQVVAVAVGGGGLIAGIGGAFKHLRPEVQVIGVEAAGAASMIASLAAGHPVALRRMHTMADGIAVKSPSELTLRHTQAFVDDLVTVSEEEISQALVLLLERAKAVVEPSGAATLAAVLSGRLPGSGPAIAVLGGGNIDPLLLTKVIDHGLSAAGRYVAVRVLLDDLPGNLARLTGEVARLGLNVLAVEHHRSGLDLPMAAVEVLLTLETRNAVHSDEILADLRAAGFEVAAAR
jgi:threonine dehydratase